MIRTNTETKTETEKESAMLIELTEEELESMCGGTDFPHGVYVHVDVDGIRAIAVCGLTSTLVGSSTKGSYPLDAG